MAQSTAAALPIAAQAPDLMSQYATSLLFQRAQTQVDDILREMEEIARVETIPIIGPLQGALIQLLLKLRQPAARRILDIGTSIGYSAIWLARNQAPGSHVTTIEIDAERATRARQFIDRAGLTRQITVLEGDAFQLLPQLANQYEIILQDIMKHVYFAQDDQLAATLLNISLDRLARGGMLLSDNAFCLGKVLDDDSPYNQVAGIQRYNELVAHHPDLLSVIVPIRDGMWVSYYQPQKGDG